MHFIIENVIKKYFRDLIIEIHPPPFPTLFSKPEMNFENGCLIFCFVLFIYFVLISIHWKLS